MNILKAKTLLAYAVKANQPTILIGSPGSGKSSIVAQVAKEFDIGLIDVRVSQLEAIDLRGIPTVVDNKTTWNPPDFLPVSGKGILLLDELTSASPSMQTACYQLILDRRLGDYHLPDGWTVVAAGNKLSDRAVVNPLSSALKTRLFTIHVESDFTSWKSWALVNGIHPTIMSFLAFRPEMLNVFESEKISHTSASFATERTWTMLSGMLDHVTHPDDIRVVAEGLVGLAESIAYTAFARYHTELPSIEEITENPTKARLPTSASANYAVAAMITYYATPAAFAALAIYINRLPLEFQAMIVRDIVRAKPAIAASPAFSQWAINNRDIVFA